MTSPATPRNSSFWIRRLSLAAMAAVVIGMLLILAGVFQSKVPSEPAIPTTEPAAGLTTAVAELIRQPRYETASGSVKPVHEAAVASRLLARVLEISVTAGQSVSQDQVLVRLDDADLQARLRQAEAVVNDAEVRRDRAVLDAARAEQLRQKNAVSTADFEGAIAARKSADAALALAQEGVREAQITLSYATIRSPLSGIVVDKRVEVGDTVTPGQVLLTLFDPGHMQLVASVRESLALQLKPGQQLKTRLDALDLDCEATISEVVPEADIASRSFTVKVTGPCPPGVHSGMFGRLLLPVGEEQLLVIPAAAVQRIGQLTIVELVQGQIVVRRYVRIGRTLDTQVEVLSGLQAGDVVVLR